MSTCRRSEEGLSCHPATLVGIDLCSSSTRTAWLWCATLANHLCSSPSQPIQNGLRLRWSCYLVRLLQIAQISWLESSTSSCVICLIKSKTKVSLAIGKDGFGQSSTRSEASHTFIFCSS